MNLIKEIFSTRGKVLAILGLTLEIIGLVICFVYGCLGLLIVVAGSTLLAMGAIDEMIMYMNKLSSEDK